MATTTKRTSPKHSLAERLNRSRRHRQWANSQLDSASVGAASISSTGNASTNSEPPLAPTPHQRLRARAPLSLAQSPSGDNGSVDSGTTPSPEKRETLASRRARAIMLQKKRGAFSPRGQLQEPTTPPDNFEEAAKPTPKDEVVQNREPSMPFKASSSQLSQKPRNPSKQPMSPCESVQYQASEMDSHKTDNDVKETGEVTGNGSKFVHQPKGNSSGPLVTDRYRVGSSFRPVAPSPQFSKAPPPPPPRSAPPNRNNGEVPLSQAFLTKSDTSASNHRFSTGSIRSNSNQSSRPANQGRSTSISSESTQEAEEVEGFNGSVIETPQSASVARLRASFNRGGSDKPLMPMNSPDPRIRHSIGLVGQPKVQDSVAPNYRSREPPGRTAVNERDQSTKVWQKPVQNVHSGANRPSWQNRNNSNSANTHHGQDVSTMPGQRPSWQNRPAPQAQTGTSRAANANMPAAPWQYVPKTDSTAPKNSWQGNKTQRKSDDHVPSQARWQNRSQPSVATSEAPVQRPPPQPSGDTQRLEVFGGAMNPVHTSWQNRRNGHSEPIQPPDDPQDSKNQSCSQVVDVSMTPPREQSRPNPHAGSSSPVVMPPMDERHVYRSKEETEQHKQQQYDWRSQTTEAASPPETNLGDQQVQKPATKPSSVPPRNEHGAQALQPVILPRTESTKISLPPAILPMSGVSAKSLPPVILPQKDVQKKSLPPAILPQSKQPLKSLPPAILPQAQPLPPAILPQRGKSEMSFHPVSLPQKEHVDSNILQQKPSPQQREGPGVNPAAIVMNRDTAESAASRQATPVDGLEGNTSEPSHFGDTQKPPTNTPPSQVAKNQKRWSMQSREEATGVVDTDYGERPENDGKVLSHHGDDNDYLEEKKSGEDIVPSGRDHSDQELLQEQHTHLAQMAADSTLIADYEEAIKHASKGMSYDEEDESYISGGLANSASALPHELPPEFQQALAVGHSALPADKYTESGPGSGEVNADDNLISPQQSSPDSASRYPRISPSRRDNEAYRTGYYGDDGQQLRRTSPPKDHRRNSQGDLSPTKDHVSRYQESLSVRMAAMHNSAPIRYYDQAAYDGHSYSEEAEYESPQRSPHVGQGYLSSDYSASMEESYTDVSTEQTATNNVSSVDGMGAGTSGDEMDSHVVFGDPSSFGAAGVAEGGVSPSIRRRGTAIENWRGGRKLSQARSNREREGRSNDRQKGTASQILKFWASGTASEEEQEEAQHFQDTEEWADRDPDIDSFRETSPPPSPEPESRPVIGEMPPSNDSHDLRTMKGWRQAPSGLAGATMASPAASAHITPTSRELSARSTLHVSGSNDRSDARSKKSKRSKDVFDPFGGADDLKITDSSDLFSPLPDPFMTEESFSPPVWDTPRSRDTSEDDDSSPEWSSQVEI